MKQITKPTLPLNPKYTAILTLGVMLKKASIPHILDRLLDGWQIVYPNNDDRVMDAIEHQGSYGRENNLLEIMGLLTPKELKRHSVAGNLTTEDVFNRIKKHWEEVN